MPNHVIDPTFFNDAIEMFAFNYDWYVNSGKTLNDEGKRINKYEKKIIKGSIQSEGLKVRKSKSGNIQEWTYSLYCKSFYRIKDGDFICYQGKWLRVESFQDYDEWGVRECHLVMVQLSACKDLKEFVKYEEGEKII